MLWPATAGACKSLTKFSGQRHLLEALQTAEIMKQQGVSITRNDAYYLLQACQERKDLDCTRRLQSLMIQSGIDSLAVLGDHLIRLFHHNASTLEANQIYNNVAIPSTHSWAAIILTNAKLGQEDMALALYDKIQESGMEINNFVYVAVLNACTLSKDLLHGKFIHNQIIQNGLQCSVVVGSSLVNMYAKCGDLEEAGNMFQKLKSRDAVAWNSMISAYVQYGEGSLAVACFEKMQQQCISPDQITFSMILKACARIGAIHHGRIIHEKIIGCGFEHEVVIGCALVDLYSKCKSLDEASQVLHGLPNQNVVSWNAIIAGYAYSGISYLALECFEMMQQHDIQPDRATFCVALKSCADVNMLEKGRILHDQIIERGFQSDVVVGSALVDFYAKYGSLVEACMVFDKLQRKNVISWATIIAAYAQHDDGLKALEYFQRMQEQGITPDKVTFLAVLKACTAIGAKTRGRAIHDQILNSGLKVDAVLGSTLIDMYAKCGELQEASKVFEELPNQDVVSWGAIIAAYAHSGDCHLALEYFEIMQDRGIEADQVIYVVLLKVCADMKNTIKGRVVHDQMLRNGMKLSSLMGSALINMYATCGRLEEAYNVFETLPDKDVVTWSAMMAGCIHFEGNLLVLELFEKMQLNGIIPINVTFFSILKVCATMCLENQGRAVHEQIIKLGLQSDISLANSLIDMYAKCRCYKEASQVFSKLPTRDVVSWNAMMAGYAQHGEGLLALKHLEKMQQEGAKPDNVTYSIVMNACIGAIDQGRLFHEHLVKTGLTLDIVVWNTVVDMYAKSGSLEEACKVFGILPYRNIVSWNAMITGYAHHGEGFLALVFFERMLQDGIAPDEVSFTSVLIACSRAGLLDEGRWYFRSMRKCHGIVPNTSHYACIVDLLGRAGSIIEAENLLWTANQENIEGWMSLLTACRLHGDIELGRRYFYHIVFLDPACGGAYVLLSNILSDAHMYKEAYDIIKMKKGHLWT